MKGALKSRRGAGLRRRCPSCKVLRKYCEPDGNHGGESHPRRPDWGFDATLQKPICGWCAMRKAGVDTFSDSSRAERRDLSMSIVRDVKTGRILSRTKAPVAKERLDADRWFYETGKASDARGGLPLPGRRSAMKRFRSVVGGGSDV